MNNMDNLDGDKIIEEAEKSLERLSRKIEQLEYDSKRYVLKYFETRSYTDGFQRNNAKCLDEKGISRFVPHSSF